MNIIHRLLLATVVLSGSGLLGCVADDPVEPTDALLRVSIDSCAPDTEDRATAVSIGDGLALTVAHAFDDADTLSLIDADGSEVEAHVVYLDRGRDIALVAFEPAGVGIGPQRGLLLHSDADDPADRAHVVVYRGGTAVLQPVELLQRTAVTLDGEGRRDSIKLSAAIEAGDSGAPVVDEEGRIIGMVFATSRTGDTGWAIAGSEFVDVRDRAGAPIPLRC